MNYLRKLFRLEKIKFLSHSSLKEMEEYLSHQDFLENQSTENEVRFKGKAPNRNRNYNRKFATVREIIIIKQDNMMEASLDVSNTKIALLILFGVTHVQFLIAIFILKIDINYSNLPIFYIGFILFYLVAVKVAVKSVERDLKIDKVRQY